MGSQLLGGSLSNSPEQPKRTKLSQRLLARIGRTAAKTVETSGTYADSILPTISDQLLFQAKNIASQPEDETSYNDQQARVRLQEVARDLNRPVAGDRSFIKESIFDTRNSDGMFDAFAPRLTAALGIELIHNRGELLRRMSEVSVTLDLTKDVIPAEKAKAVMIGSEGYPVILGQEKEATILWPDGDQEFIARSSIYENLLLTAHLQQSGAANDYEMMPTTLKIIALPSHSTPGTHS